MIVYHGGLEIIKKPDVAHSYRRLDFGKGFYVTTVRVQAEKWVSKTPDFVPFLFTRFVPYFFNAAH